MFKINGITTFGIWIVTIGTLIISNEIGTLYSLEPTTSLIMVAMIIILIIHTIEIIFKTIKNFITIKYLKKWDA